MTRQLIALLTAFFLFVAQATSGIFWFQPALAPAGGGGGCTWGSGDSAIYDGTAVTDPPNTQLDSGVFVGLQFTIAATYTITGYKVKITDLDGVGTVTASLYTDVAGDAGTQVSGSSIGVGHADITDTPTYEIQNFQLASPKTGLTSGTYWVHIATGASSFFNIPMETTGSRRTHYDGIYDSSSDIAIAVMGCAE